MEIRDIQGGVPTAAIAVRSQASYQAVGVPERAGTWAWSITGADPAAVIAGPANGPQVTVSAVHRSAVAGDLRLLATFTPADLSAPATAALDLTVFAAEIHSGGSALLPALSVGLGNVVTYQAAVVPALPSFTPYWEVGGADGRIAMVGDRDPGSVRVMGLSISKVRGDATLTLTIQVGTEASTTSLDISVFGVGIRLRPGKGLIGVGQVARCSAVVLPAGLIPSDGGAVWQWSVSKHLQLMGDVDRQSASVVANAPSASVFQDWIRIAVMWQGSTARARVRLTALGVSIRGPRLSEPPTALDVGQSVRYQAVVSPEIDVDLAAWSAGLTATVQPEGLFAEVAGVRASAYEGSDGLEVYIVAGSALTRALIPLTVKTPSIRVS